MFRAAGCTVKNLEGSMFEVVHDDLPVRTHVYANPYYVQLGTYILAKPQRVVKETKVWELLCDLNLKAKLVKFTMEAEKPDKQTAAWPILANAKLVTGVVGGNFEASAIRNLFLLWLHDIAETMANVPESFEMHPMMEEAAAARLKEIEDSAGRE